MRRWCCSPAHAFPAAYVDGYDSDPASAAAAQWHAAEAGLGDRVTFHTADAATLTGPYDLAHPQRVLAGLNAALTDGGTVLVADERVADGFTAPRLTTRCPPTVRSGRRHGPRPHCVGR